MTRSSRALALFAAVSLACVSRQGPAPVVATAPTQSPASPTSPAPSRCLLVDSDGGLDDFRAITALAGGAPSRGMRVAGVVATSGISSATGGARALRELLRRLGKEDIPVVEGAATQARPERDQNDVTRWWRGTAENLNGLLGEVPPPPTGTLPAWSEGATADPNALRERVRVMLTGCAQVELVMIAPWTSYSAYAPALDGHEVHVTAQGCAPDFARECGRRGYNCRLDCDACQRGVSARANAVTWVSVPPDALWSPTPEWFAGLGDGRGATVLRDIFTRAPNTWTCANVSQPCVQTYLWDDSAAVCALEPSRCGDETVPVCAHHRPHVAADLTRVLGDAIRALR